MHRTYTLLFHSLPLYPPKKRCSWRPLSQRCQVVEGAGNLVATQTPTSGTAFDDGTAGFKANERWSLVIFPGDEGAKSQKTGAGLRGRYGAMFVFLEEKAGETGSGRLVRVFCGFWRGSVVQWVEELVACIVWS